MLNIPVFRPWRSIWDTQLSDKMTKLDAIAARRQRGRQRPPALEGLSDHTLVLAALNSSRARLDSPEILHQKIEPLLLACVWPRWLLLEEALDQASTTGDLHLAALVLRTQIEELDALNVVAELFEFGKKTPFDSEAVAEKIRFLQSRVLPRLESKNREELTNQASDKEIADKRHESLKLAFNQLSEYVHPNYGSHILSVRPHSTEAATIVADAFIVIYEAFFQLPWVENDNCDHIVFLPLNQTSSNDPFRILADVTLPILKKTYSVEMGHREADWKDAEGTFHHFANCESNWESAFGTPPTWPTDVEAIKALRESQLSPSLWPDSLKTISGQNRYSFLIQQELRLAQAANSLPIPNGSYEGNEQLSILVPSLSFSIEVIEYKMWSMARQAARLVNADSVLGVTLLVRSMLEHHALAFELGEKLTKAKNEVEKSAPNSGKISELLANAEKQLARVLAGSSNLSGATSEWRRLWRESIKKPYNILTPLGTMNSKQPGVLSLYGFLSHVAHGTIATGGDLLGGGGEGWKSGHKIILAQLTLMLSTLCGIEAMMDRQVASMLTGSWLDSLREKSTDLGKSIKAKRILEGQKLKFGRDIFGVGTKDDPYRFREGLDYHPSFYHYLSQEGLKVDSRSVALFKGAFGDEVKLDDGSVLYFMNSQLNI